MRKILFRGKRIDNGEWVKGSFWDEVPGELVCIAQYGSCVFHHVDLATVGQFTGLTDKNGKKIFEGDIVRYYQSNDYHIVMMVAWRKSNASFVLAFSGEFYSVISLMSAHIFCEVIGNIHDNPELLNGGNEG